jgi:hypothetical protein
MRIKSLVAVTLLFFCIVAFLGFSYEQSCQPIDRKQLREMLVQLGYNVNDLVKDPGLEKFSIVLTRDGLDIPIAAEMSSNSRYIWLTVNLGAAKPENSLRNLSLLKQNAKAQPCQFYITDSGKLMMGLPVENHGLSNAVLRERIESIASRVSESKVMWQ